MSRLPGADRFSRIMFRKLRQKMPFRFAAALALSSVAAQAGSLLINPVNGRALRWPSPNITMRLSRTVHNASGDLGVDRRDTADSVHAAVADAVAAWNRANGISVKIELTNDTAIVPGQTLITFTDPAPFDQGLCSKERFIACVLHWIGGDGVPVGVTIAFNPYKKHSSNGLPNTFDIGLLTLHEIGHALGLGHSTVLDSIMSAAPEQEPSDPSSPQFALRQISRDDALTLAANYTEVPFDAGRVEGVVRQQGAAFPGAEVAAIDPLGRVVFSSLSGPDGSYSLAVPGGDYNIVVGAPFAPMFWTAGGGSTKDKETVSVASKAVKGGVDFAMTSGPAFNVLNIGILAGDLFYFGYPSLPLGRGRDTTIGFQRESATPPASIEVPPAVGEFLEAARGEVFSGGVNIVLRKLRIPASAEPGAYYFLVKTDDANAFLNGGLKISLSPVVESILDEASGEASTAVRAGQRIAITGTDLALAATAGEQWQSGAPFPTQLAGVSVRFGDRYGQIASASPTRIVTIVPSGLASKVDVAVVSAPSVESKPFSIDIQ